MGIFGDIIDAAKGVGGAAGDVAGGVNDVLNIPLEWSKGQLGEVGYQAERFNQYLGDPLRDGQGDWERIKKGHQEGGGRGAWEAIVNDDPLILRAALDIGADPLSWLGGAAKGVGAFGQEMNLLRDANVLRGAGDAKIAIPSILGATAKGAETGLTVAMDPLKYVGKGLRGADNLAGSHVQEGLSFLGGKAKGSRTGKFFTELTDAAKSSRFTKDLTDLAIAGRGFVRPDQKTLDRAIARGTVDPSQASEFMDPLLRDNPANVLDHFAPVTSDKKALKAADEANPNEVVMGYMRGANAPGKRDYLYMDKDGLLKQVPQEALNAGPQSGFIPLKTLGDGEILKMDGNGRMSKKTIEKINAFTREYGNVAGPGNERLMFQVVPEKAGTEFTLSVGMRGIDDELSGLGSYTGASHAFDYRGNAIRDTIGGAKNNKSPFATPDDLRGFISEVQGARMSPNATMEVMAERGGSAFRRTMDDANPMKYVSPEDTPAPGSLGTFAGIPDSSVGISRAAPMPAGMTPDDFTGSPLRWENSVGRGVFSGPQAGGYVWDVGDPDLVHAVMAYTPQLQKPEDVWTLIHTVDDYMAKNPGIQDDDALHTLIQNTLGLHEPDYRLAPGPFNSSPNPGERVVSRGPNGDVIQSVRPDTNQGLTALSPEENDRLLNESVLGESLMTRVTDTMDEFAADRSQFPELFQKENRWERGASDGDIKKKIDEVYASDPVKAKAALEATTKWKRLGVDLSRHDEQAALNGMIDRESKQRFGVKVEKRGKYKTMRSLWAEMALFSPRYITSNMVGNTLQGMIVNRFDWRKSLEFADTKSFRTTAKVGMANLTGSETIDHIQGTRTFDIFERMGRGPGNAVTQQTQRAIVGSEERSSEIGHLAKKIFGDRLGRKLAKVPEGAQALAYGADVTSRSALFNQIVDDQWERIYRDEVTAKVAKHIKDSGVDLSFDPLPTQNPKELEFYLRNQGVSSGYAKRASQDLASANNKILGESTKVVNKTYLNFDKTRADEFVANIVPFHYWASRMMPWYAHQAMSNPVLLANYVRSLQGIQRAYEDPEGNAREKGFLRMLAGPGGFSLLMNPDSLMGVIKIGGILSGDQGKVDGDSSSPTFIGNVLGSLKKYGVGLYPWIDGAANMIGTYGDTFEPDMIGIRHRAIVGAAINEFAAEFGLGMPGSPYADLNDEARSKLSGWASILLPDWLSKPVAKTDGGSINTISIENQIENRIIDKNPGLTNQQLVTIMSNPESKEYKEAYKDVARNGLLAQASSFILPVSIKAREDASDVRAAQSKMVTEEAKKLGVRPDDMARAQVTPEFAAEYKRKTGEDFHYQDVKDAKEKRAIVNASPKGRQFEIMDQGYKSLGNQFQRDVYDKYQKIRNGQVIYRGVNTAFETQATRDIMAFNYLNTVPNGEKIISDLRSLQQSYRQQNPEYNMFKDWQGKMNDIQSRFGGDLSMYRQLASERDPEVARFFQDKANYYMAQGITGDALVQRLDQDTKSSELYLLINGVAAGDFDPQRSGPTTDPMLQMQPDQQSRGDVYTPGNLTQLYPQSQPPAFKGIWSRALEDYKTGNTVR